MSHFRIRTSLRTAAARAPIRAVCAVIGRFISIRVLQPRGSSGKPVEDYLTCTVYCAVKTSPGVILFTRIVWMQPADHEVGNDSP